MFGTHQPVTQHLKKTAVSNISRGIKVARKRADGLFVDLEKQSVLAAEVLKDRPFGDTECSRNVSDPRRVITLLGKMAHSGIDDSGSFAFRTGPWRHATVARGRNQAASNSTHIDLKS